MACEMLLTPGARFMTSSSVDSESDPQLSDCSPVSEEPCLQEDVSGEVPCIAEREKRSFRQRVQRVFRAERREAWRFSVRYASSVIIFGILLYSIAALPFLLGVSLQTGTADVDFGKELFFLPLAMWTLANGLFANLNTLLTGVLVIGVASRVACRFVMRKTPLGALPFSRDSLLFACLHSALLYSMVMMVAAFFVQAIFAGSFRQYLAHNDGGVLFGVLSFQRFAEIGVLRLGFLTFFIGFVVSLLNFSRFFGEKPGDLFGFPAVETDLSLVRLLAQKAGQVFLGFIGGISGFFLIVLSLRGLFAKSEGVPDVTIATRLGSVFLLLGEMLWSFVDFSLMSLVYAAKLFVGETPFVVFRSGFYASEAFIEGSPGWLFLVLAVPVAAFFLGGVNIARATAPSDVLTAVRQGLLLGPVAAFTGWIYALFNGALHPTGFVMWAVLFPLIWGACFGGLGAFYHAVDRGLPLLFHRSTALFVEQNLSPGDEIGIVPSVTGHEDASAGISEERAAE